MSARLRSGGPCSRTADDLSRLTLTSTVRPWGLRGLGWEQLSAGPGAPAGGGGRGCGGPTRSGRPVLRGGHRGRGAGARLPLRTGRPGSRPPSRSSPGRLGPPSPEIPWPRATSTAQDGSDLQLVAWEGAHSTCLPDMFSSLTLEGISPDREQTRIVNGKAAGAAARVPVPRVPLRARWGSAGAAETNSPGLCPPHQLEEAGGTGVLGRGSQSIGPGGQSGWTVPPVWRKEPVLAPGQPATCAHPASARPPWGALAEGRGGAGPGCAPLRPPRQAVHRAWG